MAPSIHKNKKLIEEYVSISQLYLKDNIIEKFPNEDTLPCNLTNRAVIRNDYSSTKLRIDFDAPAHYTTEPYLNNILEAEPCLLPYLLDIFLRFRTAVVADIKQAFLQIEINENDRNLDGLMKMIDFDGLMIFTKKSTYRRVSLYKTCARVKQSVLT